MTTEERDRYWMQRAMQLAAAAEAEGEVPVGAVLVLNDEVIGEGWNRPIASHDATAHAEIQAIRAAGQRIGNYRLTGSTLYVTLEPCVMCVGAIVHARVGRLVFGAHEPKTGAVRSCFPLLGSERHNHQTAVSGGVLEEECGAQLRRFFRQRRNQPRSRMLATGDDQSG
jgi:tRNA(adenine34) deaminase